MADKNAKKRLIVCAYIWGFASINIVFVLLFSYVEKKKYIYVNII